jgi:hypothetical protein
MGEALAGRFEMNFASAAGAIGFFVVSAVTFLIWLNPPARQSGRLARMYPVLAAVIATVFFLMCFSFGVWFSVLRMRGEMWML